MITLQIINKILARQELDLLTKNHITKDYFLGYEEEYEFIFNHFERYGKVPDKTTFLSKFKDFELVEVSESDQYLLDTLQEEHLYYKSVQVVQKVAELLKVNSNEAVEYLRTQIPFLEPPKAISGTDIISKANERLEIYNQKRIGQVSWYIPTGFEELDNLLNGWTRGEELAVIFARTGQGKSWVLAKTLMHAWEIGNNVGYISPEMSPTKIGYRFDTLHGHFSNQNLIWGNQEIDYEKYIEDLKKHKNPFIVATPNDFQKKITVSKIKTFIQSHKLSVLGIDGITYLTDERYKKGDNKTITLTNLSEDLISLSLELKVPILVVVQSNRSGIKDPDTDGTPELESIRDSDGIAHNATKVISLRQTGVGLEFGIKKHRDGATGGKIIYHWNIDKGEFNYIPCHEDFVEPQARQEKIKKIKDSFQDGANVF